LLFKFCSICRRWPHRIMRCLSRVCCCGTKLTPRHQPRTFLFLVWRARVCFCEGAMSLLSRPPLTVTPPPHLRRFCKRNGI
jgi:hypothetical protein